MMLPNKEACLRGKFRGYVSGRASHLSPQVGEQKIKVSFGGVFRVCVSGCVSQKWNFSACFASEHAKKYKTIYLFLELMVLKRYWY